MSRLQPLTTERSLGAPSHDPRLVTGSAKASATASDPDNRVAPAEPLRPRLVHPLVLLHPYSRWRPCRKPRSGRSTSCASLRARPRSAWCSVSRWRRGSRCARLARRAARSARRGPLGSHRAAHSGPHLRSGSDLRQTTSRPHAWLGARHDLRRAPRHRVRARGQAFHPQAATPPAPSRQRGNVRPRMPGRSR
jgi:hypothetical protein